ncbi:MAG: ABC transporter substrate-binding protein [Hydrogenophaga sp.]|uniref:ABC transporter substrate-binding protein n=1 Tax=Hydrogenophaga sp. TaxID=1904254 RepID=UPI001DDC0221|nr:ABC transporter substrate-binding protein [Hydrogenophaga sp.]MBX3611852.1 ABC transporter substrate-binding protein [Hydrogenophaga sp.]
MRRRHVLQAAAAAATATPLFVRAQESNEITVAQISPFTVLPAPDAKELFEGAQAAFDEINGKGGVGGRKVNLLKYDDAYSYDGFKARLAEAMARKPLALFSPIGSGTLKQMLDNKVLDTTDVIVLNAIPGAAVIREPGHPKLFHVRAGDEQQIRKIVAHAQALNIRSLVVLYQNIPMGSSGLASAQAAAQGTDLKVSGAQSSPAVADLEKAAGNLVESNPHAALVIGAPKFMGQAVAALRAAGMSQQIFSLSYLPAPALKALAGAGARGVGIAQTFPNPNGVTLPLQRAFRASMQRTHQDLKTYTPFHLEGYLTAQVFTEAARKSRALTPTALGESLHRMGELDLGGFRVDFSKGNEGSHWVDIGVATADGRLIY